MTAPRAGTWLGDAAAVIDALDLTSDEDVRRIAPMLGLAYAEEHEAAPEPDLAPDAVSAVAAPQVPAPAAATRPRVSRLRALAPLALPALAPVSIQPPVETASAPDERDLLDKNEIPPPLPFRSLLRPHTAAGVAVALVRTWGPGSRIDERRTVAELARGRPVRTFPRLPRLSLYRGVQVLLDQGEAMDPYERDQQSMVSLVQRVVGARMAPTGHFENCPSRGVWLLPGGGAVRGRPVLVVTDLGLGGPQAQPARASAAEWSRYARRTARAGSPVIALVPYPPGRAHPAVRRRIAVVRWDRASVSAVQQARRRVN